MKSYDHKLYIKIVDMWYTTFFIWDLLETQMFILSYNILNLFFQTTLESLDIVIVYTKVEAVIVIYNL
jgi:hypothetical protein